MKKLFRTTFVVLILFILVGSLVKAQELPEKVQKAFNQKFLQAQQVKWEKENSDEFEVQFRLKGKQLSAEFDAEGSWLETETEIMEKELPREVTASLKKDFPKVEIVHAFSVMTNEQTVYELEVRGTDYEDGDDDEEHETEEIEEGDQEEYTRELVYTEEGKLINNKEKGDDNENNDENVDHEEENY